MQLEPKCRPQNESGKIKLQCQNTKRTYGKSNEQLSPKRWPLSYLTLTKYHLGTQKEKIVQKLTSKQANTENHTRRTALERSVILNITEGLNQYYGIPTSPSASEMVQTFSYVFCPHGKTLTSQLIITVKQIKYHEESKRRTRQMQCVARQLKIPGKPNNTTEILSKIESPAVHRWAKQQTKKLRPQPTK